MFIICLAVNYSTLCAQIDVGGMVKRKVDQRIEQKTNEAIDKTLDETERGVKESAKGGKNSKKPKDDTKNSDQGTPEEKSNIETKTEIGKTSAGNAALKSYSKFDFVPGERVMIEDRFEQVAVGDFPADWNTNSSGEIVNVEGRDGKWLKISKSGVFMPDYITDLPENFTLQMDVLVNEGFSFYGSSLLLTFVHAINRQKVGDYDIFSKHPNGVRLALHPTAAGNNSGTVGIKTWAEDRSEIIDNTVNAQQFHANKNPYARISIWRQKQRLRVYLNEEKVLDLPRAFVNGIKYDAMALTSGDQNEVDQYLITNLRLAVGTPDTRSKLITEGRFSTTGILFDVNSDKIKPESYGTLKEISAVLNENPDVKVKIIGHTDSDGSDENNLALSKKRAESVKEALQKEFAIDSARLQTDGKGESEPADKTGTQTAKVNNRRVEFVKL